jgi:aldehyde:ferredoxin oxidoreductase
MKIYGNILRVDLTDRTHRLSPFPSSSLHTCIGGRGFNVDYLFRHLPLNTDPLSPDNVLLLSCGLLTGSRAPASSRLHINAVSPLTQLLGSANIGGHAGYWLRSCNIQSLIICGRASELVYLYVGEETVEIRNAGFLNGLDTFEAQESIRETTGNHQLKILAIGPAGENLARFACIVSGKDHAAGRTGMGAVMGAKNLKAIAIDKGSWKAGPQHSAAASKAVKHYAQKIKTAPDFAVFSRYGGAGYVKWADDMGILATRNYRDHHFEEVDRIDGRRLKEKIVKKSGCPNCPVQCKAMLAFNKNGTPEKSVMRPEFESLCNLGAKCGLADLEAIVHLDNLCSRLGLDTTSAATAVAFAMDLFDRNLLSSEQTGGLDLAWGNPHAMEALIRQMAYGERLGGILARGVRQAAAIIGNGADKYAAHINGLELTAYHPGYIMGTALGYLISSRGGDYNHVYASLEYRWSRKTAVRELGTDTALDIHDVSAKGLLLKRAVLVNTVLDCLGLCKVPALSLMAAFDLKEEALLAAALIQAPISPEMLFQTGERIAALEQLFNLRRGLKKMDQRFPRMFMESRCSMLTSANLERMLQSYYRAMGWDSLGSPELDTLAALGIDTAVSPSPLKAKTTGAPQN